VDIKAVEAFKRPVSLDEIKKVKELSKMALIRLGRLSVQPVTPEEFDTITRLGSEKGTVP
jgi:predicted RNA-binding protein with PUA-like domain